jgi:hypothetical protein
MVISLWYQSTGSGYLLTGQETNAGNNNIALDEVGRRMWRRSPHQVRHFSADDLQGEVLLAGLVRGYQEKSRQASKPQAKKCSLAHGKDASSNVPKVPGTIPAGLGTRVDQYQSKMLKSRAPFHPFRHMTSPRKQKQSNEHATVFLFGKLAEKHWCHSRSCQSASS